MKKLFLLPLITLFALTSCGNQIDYKSNLDLYVVNKECQPTYHEDFTILQITDLHWSNSTPLNEQKAYLNGMFTRIKEHISNNKIDLIEFTGDTFMLYNVNVVNTFIDYMNNLKIPYTMEWGNHDREGTVHPNWLSETFMKAQYCLYNEVDNDNLNGRGNYVINLRNQTGEVKWQLFNVDSGSSYRKGSTDVKLSYDWIRDEQYDWMKKEHDNVGASIPSLAFYHIAQSDFDTLYKGIGNPSVTSKSKFFKKEGFGASKNCVASEPYFKDCNVKGAFIGHCHANDITFTSDEGMIFSCGVKTGKELYYASIKSNDPEAINLGITEDFDLCGAALITLKDDGNFDLDHFYYNLNGNNEFMKWVRY